MLVPLSWLKDYVDIDVTPDVLEEKLFSCGFEVEEKYEVGKDISKVVVGEVKTCEAIEGTHLHLCTVDAGENGVLQICCGADNVAAGGKYPLALIGAQVYATAKDHKTVEGLFTEDLLYEHVEHALKVAKRNALVYYKSFHLGEHRRMRSIVIGTENLTR